MLQPTGTVIAGVVLAAMLAGCDGSRAAPTATVTSSPSLNTVDSTMTVTPAPTTEATAFPTVTSTADPTPATATTSPGEDLIGDIAEAIEAAQAEDGVRLGGLLTATEGPCVVDPEPGILVPPSCPDGVPADTPVPAIVFGGCPDRDVGFVDPTITYYITNVSGSNFAAYLIGVVDLGAEPVHYAALFGFERTTWLGFDASGRLIGAGGGGSCATWELRPRLTEVTWLVGPNWSE